MKHVRPTVSELKPYFVLQEASLAKLNQNEFPLDIPDTLKDEIIKRLREAAWNHYPLFDAPQLTRALADFTGHPKEGIIAGGGSSEIIKIILHTFCGPGDKVAYVVPGFPLYTFFSRLMELETVEIPLGDDFQYDVDEIIRQSQDVKVLMLTNPNNPTGTSLTLEQIEYIAKNVNAILAVDEAYYEFYGVTAQHLIEKYPHILVLRTFSKALRMPSFRLGYLMGVPELCREIIKTKMPYTVGLMQQIAGQVILENYGILEKEIATVIEERNRVAKKLNDMPGVHAVPSDTNFILVCVEEKDGPQVYDAPCERGVLLRYAPSPRMKQYLRLTVGSTEENDRFLDVLGGVLNG